MSQNNKKPQGRGTGHLAGQKLAFNPEAKKVCLLVMSGTIKSGNG